jgi:hypothetical protein
MYGNNIASSKIYRIRVPLFASDEPNGKSGGHGIPNKKYFFPETPVLDNSCIVGIEAHLSTESGLLGDITRFESDKQNVTKVQAKNILVTIYGDDKTQSFASIPLISLFPNNAGTDKRVNPYYGKINTRMSYCLIIDPTGTPLGQEYYVNFSFYYNPKK